MDLYEKFKIIETYFKTIDEKKRKENVKLHFDTSYGIWGPSSMLDMFEFFMKMHLEEKNGLVDLGSGDGRIVLIAALFTNSRGIEGDGKLHIIAQQAKETLQKAISELSRCELLQSDYTKESLADYEILFTFCDHTWDAAFEKKIEKECKGTLLSYNRIFLPQKLKKGKTYWMQQVPIVTYWLNKEEKELFSRKEINR